MEFFLCKEELSFVIFFRKLCQLTKDTPFSKEFLVTGEKLISTLHSTPPELIREKSYMSKARLMDICGRNLGNITPTKYLELEHFFAKYR